MHILNESANAMWLDMHPFSPQMPPRNDAAYLRNSSRYTDSNEKLPSIVGQGLVCYIYPKSDNEMITPINTWSTKESKY